MGVKDFAAAHPSVDLVVPVVAGVAWLRWGAAVTPDAASARTEIYAGVSTLAGLVLAAATFVCAMMYQSERTYVAIVRTHYSVELRRNWRAIIGSSLVASMLPLLSMAVDGQSPAAAMTGPLVALALVATRFTRCVYWLGLTLILDEASNSVVPTIVAKLPEVPSERVA